jgi:hypothetical protein
MVPSVEAIDIISLTYIEQKSNEWPVKAKEEVGTFVENVEM